MHLQCYAVLIEKNPSVSGPRSSKACCSSSSCTLEKVNIWLNLEIYVLPPVSNELWGNIKQDKENERKYASN